jgi:hypothetical protein
VGIDTVIDLACDPKEALGTDGIVALLKSRSRAETVIRLAREGGDRRSPSEITFQIRVVGPGGEPEPRAVDAQSLLDQSAALDAHAADCEDCPANLTDTPFGCVGYVSYPIERASERWLLDRLPDEIESTAGQLVSRAIADFGWEEGYAAELRRQGDMFFETTELERRSWDRDELVVDSNQAFNMLFGVGHLGAAHCRMLSLFFGVVPAQIDLDELMSMDVEALMGLAIRARLGAVSAQTAALGRTVQALTLAAALDCELLIDG